MFARKALIAAVSVLLLASVATAREAQHFTLRNGLKGVLVENHANPFVALTAVVHAGSLDEQRGTAGSSHFLEHLLFNGTAEMTQRELYDAADRIGAYNNASTRADHTVFLILAPSRHLQEVANIQSQMLFHSTLKDAAFDKERGIVSEEIGKDRDRESYRVRLLLDREVYAGTRLAEPTLGTVSDIQGLDPDAVRAYYRKFYVPSNVTLLVVGDVTRDDLLPVLESTYGAVERPPVRAARPLHIDTRNMMTLLPADSQKTWFKVVLPGPDAGSEEATAVSVVMDLWNEGMFATGDRPVVTGGLRQIRQSSFIELQGALPESMGPQQAIDRVRADLQRTVEVPLGRDVVRRKVREARVAEAGLLERPHYFGLMRADVIAAAGLDAALGRIGSLRGLTPEFLTETARKWLAGARIEAAAAGPGLSRQRVTLRQMKAPAETQNAQTAPMKKEEARITRHALPNGLTVLIEEDPTSNLAAFHVLARDRSAHEPRGKAGIADLMHRLLPKGTENRSADEIHEELSTLGATLKVTDASFIPYDDYYFSSEFSYIRLEVLSEDARAAFQLLADLVLHPSFEQESVQAERSSLLGVLQGKETEARYRARAAYREAIFGNHPLSSSPLGSHDTVSGITRDDLVTFHRSYFSPDNLILSVVSPLPAEQVLASIRQHFGSARRSGYPPKITRIHSATTERPRRVLELGRDQAVLYMGRVVNVSEEDWPALVAANAVLSDRLSFNIREREGLAYVVGSSLQRSPYGTWLTMTAGTDPDQVEKAERMMRGELSRLDRSLSQAELDRAGGRLVGRALMRRLPSISRAYYLGLGELEGRSPGQDLELLEAIQNVEPREVRKAAGKYFSDGPLVVVEAR